MLLATSPVGTDGAISSSIIKGSAGQRSSDVSETQKSANNIISSLSALFLAL